MNFAFSRAHGDAIVREFEIRIRRTGTVIDGLCDFRNGKCVDELSQGPGIERSAKLWRRLLVVPHALRQSESCSENSAALKKGTSSQRHFFSLSFMFLLFMAARRNSKAGMRRSSFACPRLDKRFPVRLIAYAIPSRRYSDSRREYRCF